MTSKVRRYLQEVWYAWNTGRTPVESMRLAADTLRFHAANLFGTGNQSENSQIRRYRVAFPGHPHSEIHLRSRTGDYFVFYEVFLDECYRLPSWLRGKPMRILDLGANIGLTSLYFSTLVPDARLACVEPDEANVRLLRMNLAALGDRVQVISGAVGERTTSRLFLPGPTWGGALDSGGNERAPHADGRAVACYSMADIIARTGFDRIDLLKMDVEGAEKEIFAGDLTWLSVVDVILIELHGPYALTEFKEAVARVGFSVFEPGSRLENRVIMALSRGALDRRPAEAKRLETDGPHPT